MTKKMSKNEWSSEIGKERIIIPIIIQFLVIISVRVYFFLYGGYPIPILLSNATIILFIGLELPLYFLYAYRVKIETAHKNKEK